MTSAITARPARDPLAVGRPHAGRPAARRPRSGSPGAQHRISPPSDRIRRASAWVSSPAPPSGHREADGLAEHAQQQAHQPGARRVERDVGVAGVAGEQQPRGRRRRTGRGPARWPGTSSVRTKSSPPTERSRASARAARAAPAGTARAARRPAGRRSGPTARRGRARPHRRRRGLASMRAAVTWRSRCSSAHEPSGRGCPSTAGACCHRRPWSSRWKARIVGEAAASG